MRLILFLLAMAGYCGKLLAQDSPEWTESEKQFIRFNATAAKRVTGFYSSRAQADTATSKYYASQDIRSYAIWEDYWLGKRPELWLYFGWFSTGIPDNPLVEFIAQMKPITKDSILISWYRIPKGNQYKREWERTSPFRDLSPEIMQERPSACRCYLTQTNPKEGRIVSIVPCPINNSIGSKFKYFAFDITMKSNMNVARNKFYDADFNVIFELKDPAFFKLLTRNKMQFTEQE